MVLAERAQALALTKFATMVRQDDARTKEPKKAADDMPAGRGTHAGTPHGSRSVDLLPPIVWGDPPRS